MTKPKPIKQHWLACPVCGAKLECYRTYPKPDRVTRTKRCTNAACGQQHQTIEIRQTEYDQMRAVIALMDKSDVLRYRYQVTIEATTATPTIELTGGI